MADTEGKVHKPTKLPDIHSKAPYGTDKSSVKDSQATGRTASNPGGISSSK